MVPVLRVKDSSVQFKTLAPGGFRILAALDNASKVMGCDILISCGSEGHPPSDPHSRGEAVDISVRDFTVPEVIKLKRFLEQTLGQRFTVLYETPHMPTEQGLLAIAYVNGKATAPHMHIQVKKAQLYQPEDPVAA